jgi:hypothetical protein
MFSIKQGQKLWSVIKEHGQNDSDDEHHCQDAAAAGWQQFHAAVRQQQLGDGGRHLLMTIEDMQP